MPFSLHVNKPSKRASAHPAGCPEVPDAPVNHKDNYWQAFGSRTAIEAVIQQFKNRDFEAHWCDFVPGADQRRRLPEAGEKYTQASAIAAKIQQHPDQPPDGVEQALRAEAEARNAYMSALRILNRLLNGQSPE